MLRGITILFLFQLLGELAAYCVGGLIPGPVIGMVMITIFLSIASRRNILHQWGQSVVGVSRPLLANLGVLFVPAGVGIVQHVDLVRERAVALSVVIGLSTLITLATTVGVFVGVRRLVSGQPQ